MLPTRVSGKQADDPLAAGVFQNVFLTTLSNIAKKEGLLKFSETIDQITGKGWTSKSLPYDRFHCLIVIWCGGEPPQLPSYVKLHRLNTQGWKLKVPLEVGAQKAPEGKY